MRIIASANQKGGCGKTTTAINLSFSLGLKGLNVLLIDFDPQAHATMGLNVRPSDLEKSMYDLMKPGEYNFTRIADIIIPIRDYFHLAPSSAALSAVEQELSGVDGRESRLFNAIESLNKAYDFIIIGFSTDYAILKKTGVSSTSFSFTSDIGNSFLIVIKNNTNTTINVDINISEKGMVTFL